MSSMNRDPVVDQAACARVWRLSSWGLLLFGGWGLYRTLAGSPGCFDTDLWPWGCVLCSFGLVTPLLLPLLSGRG